MLKLDENEKEAVRDLGASVNGAIEKSTSVARAIERLRALGFEPRLTVKLEIALQKIGEPHEADEDDFAEEDFLETDAGDVDFELTDEDVRTLRRMKISLE